MTTYPLFEPCVVCRSQSVCRYRALRCDGEAKHGTQEQSYKHESSGFPWVQTSPRFAPPQQALSWRASGQRREVSAR